MVESHPPAGSSGGPSIIASYSVSADDNAGDLEGSMALDDRFPIASITKTLTALLAARLSSDGVVSWDQALPPQHRDAPATSLRTLLMHTAAVPFELDPSHWHGPSLTRAELKAALRSMPRLPLPPHTWHYSNFGYALVGAHLEQATGQAYPDLLGEHLLEPLGMVNTSLPRGAAEGPALLGAAAPAGDMWSTLQDLTVLARALDGHRPDVITSSMLALMLQAATPNFEGECIGAGIRSYAAGLHRPLVTSGTIGNTTSCLVVWPRRGYTVSVAQAGYSHVSLRDSAIHRWSRNDESSRSWWWDGQEVIELRRDDVIELHLRETTWPFPLFSGRIAGRRLLGVDWQGQTLELADRGTALDGAGIVLTAEVSDSAFAATAP